MLPLNLSGFQLIEQNGLKQNVNWGWRAGESRPGDMHFYFAFLWSMHKVNDIKKQMVWDTAILIAVTADDPSTSQRNRCFDRQNTGNMVFYDTKI